MTPVAAPPAALWVLTVEARVLLYICAVWTGVARVTIPSKLSRSRPNFHDFVCRQECTRPATECCATRAKSTYVTLGRSSIDLDTFKPCRRRYVSAFFENDFSDLKTTPVTYDTPWLVLAHTAD